MNRPIKTIAIDFDNTLFQLSNNWPYPGDPLPGAVDTVRFLHAAGCKLILFTLRNGRSLRLAKAALKKHDVLKCFSKINKNLFNPHFPLPTRKIAADLYIDDRALGIDLFTNKKTSQIDWFEIKKHLKNNPFF